jgi:hypothetical protein
MSGQAPSLSTSTAASDVFLTTPPPAASAPAAAPALTAPELTNKVDGSKTDQANFLNNNTLKAVLYIILILYASVIAPKLPNWLIPYLEDPLVKIFIVFIIGWVATNDVIAAIIATIGVAVTYLFISEIKVTNCINNICDDEEENNNIKSNEPKETKELKEPKQTKELKEIKEPRETKEQIDKEYFNSNYNLEHLNGFNNNNYINHVEEHFDNIVKEHFDNHIEEHFINHSEEHY